MKDVLQHQTSCYSDPSCQEPHCPSTRGILNHWRDCTHNDCPVCKPFIQKHPNSVLFCVCCIKPTLCCMLYVFQLDVSLQNHYFFYSLGVYILIVYFAKSDGFFTATSN